MFKAITIVGLLLLVSIVVMALADTADLSRRLPTQVPPRTYLRYPLVVGALLLAIGLVGSLFS